VSSNREQRGSWKWSFGGSCVSIDISNEHPCWRLMLRSGELTLLVAITRMQWSQ